MAEALKLYYALVPEQCPEGLPFRQWYVKLGLSFYSHNTRYPGRLLCLGDEDRVVLLATTATIWLTHFEPAGFTQLLSNGLGSNDDSEVDAKVIDDRLCFVRKLVKLLTVYEAKSKTTVGQQLLYSVFGRLTKDGAVPEDRKVRFAFDAIEAHLPTVIAAMPEKPSSTNSTCAGAKISA